jgi:hypothetical protein
MALAREPDVILDEMIVQKEAEPALDGLTSTSQTSIWRTILFICATAISNMEKLMDDFYETILALSKSAIAGTKGWWSARMFDFQYSATTPQQVEEVTAGVLAYPVIDKSLQIISRVAVKTNINSEVVIKLAKGDDESLEELTTEELEAANAYIDDVGFVGIRVSGISLPPDKITVNLEVYYSGSAVLSEVKTNTEQALTDYLKSISVTKFDGVLNLNDMNNAVLAATGVEDTNYATMSVNIRPDSAAYGDADNVTVVRQNETFAGYAVEETTASYTFADTITYTLS